MSVYSFIFAISFCLGFLLSRLLYPVVYALHAAFVAPFIKMKMQKSGNYKTVEAKLDYDSLKPYVNGQGYYVALYKYEVDGKEYSKVVSMERFGEFDGTIKLYYGKNPKKATEDINLLGQIEDKKSVKKYACIFFTSLIFICLVVLRWTQR